jgi:hypothetical protein
MAGHGSFASTPIRRTGADMYDAFEPGVYQLVSAER